MGLATILARTGRRHIRCALARGIAVGVVLVGLASSSVAGAFTVDGPSVLPAFPQQPLSVQGAGVGEQFVRSLPSLPFGDSIEAAGVGALDASSRVSASDVSIPFDGGYYWVGDYLFIDGWVTNDTASPVGPILLHFVVRTLGDVQVAEATGAAAIYNLPAGQEATFKHVFLLPGHAGSEMLVTAETLAYQPSKYPSAVNLALVDRSMTTDADGVRRWTCLFRNESAFTVKEPLVGGWEYDSGGFVIGTVLGVDTTKEIPPQGTITIDAYGSNLGGTPANALIYAQAMPVPPKGTNPVFRFYNVVNNTHFYTASVEERDLVISRWPHIYRYEGIAYYTNPGKNSQPLFRFYYKRTGSHFYTASVTEANLIRSKWPTIFTYEGPTFSVSTASVPGAVTVYRFINLKNSSHFYTASAEERDMVQARWPNLFRYEGPAFWLAQ